VLAGTPGPTQADVRPLPESSILGNIFFTQMAGHETAGNSMAFTILSLALYPEIQSKVQKELDEVLGDRPMTEWTVEKDFPLLSDGYMGAVQKEVMRIFNVAQFMPRKTMAPMTVHDLDGKEYRLPKDTFVYLSFAANLKNPKHYKQRGADQVAGAVIDFDPERWRDGSVPNHIGDIPVYIPFGHGGRICPGRSFAQVEMTVFLAAWFKRYSVELVVDEEVLEACGGDKEKAWQETRKSAMKTIIEKTEVIVSIQLLKEVPLRIVERSN
jgi:cytochrome P450